MLPLDCVSSSSSSSSSLAGEHSTECCQQPSESEIPSQQPSEYVLLSHIKSVWSCGISDHSVSWAMWYKDVLVAFSDHLEESQHNLLSIYCHPFVLYARRHAWICRLRWELTDWSSTELLHWCHLIASSLCRHHWSRASILPASSLVTPQVVLYVQRGRYACIGQFRWEMADWSFAELCWKQTGTTWYRAASVGHRIMYMCRKCC